jgi:hypothetical protein
VNCSVCGTKHDLFTYLVEESMDQAIQTVVTSISPSEVFEVQVLAAIKRAEWKAIHGV